MDWLTFISEIVESLAWPAAIVICIFLLREPLAQLIPLLRKLKYRDLELEFEKQVEELKNQVSAAIPTPLPDEAAEPEERVLELIDVSPRAAVIEACRDVEDAAFRAAQRHDLKLPKPTLLSAIKTLAQQELISETQSAALRIVRTVRNTAAHEPDTPISRADAHEVIRLAKVLENHLDKV